MRESLAGLIGSKRCILVCGGGGVGKTTISASIGIAAARIRSRVLVLTIDPSHRLLQAFGYPDALLHSGGEPLELSKQVKETLLVPASASLSIAVLNPRYVIDGIVDQTLSSSKASILRKTVLYREMTQMIHGLQEYTAYEWVTRMISEDRYDLIVLDTPPAFHAKEFFNAPEKIKNLMESRVFQIFLPKTGSWFKSVISFSWVERLLGEGLFRESVLFFETFFSLRDRILERCQALAAFFKSDTVGVVAVGTPESTPSLELEGLSGFLRGKAIPLRAIVINQIEMPDPAPVDSAVWRGLSPEFQEKLKKLSEHQQARSERCFSAFQRLQKVYAGVPVVPVPMCYDRDGFEILRNNSITLI
ncbi:MAG: AAA family ATPase [Bdellovibrionales bacterium]|nr:AAA family ATPase [Bdellovibrionales bacterium]